LVALLLFFLAGSGCSHRDETLPATVRASAALARPAAAALAALQEPDSGRPETLAALALVNELEDGIHRADSRDAAVQRLFRAWEAEPRHVLWPELAAREHQFLGVWDRRDELSARAVGDDTLSAMGAYVSGWRVNIPSVSERRFLAAYERRGELTPFQALWVTLKAAFSERRRGRADRARDMALATIPEARAEGGLRLEALCWREAAKSGLVLGELDDALAAVVVADTLATAAAGEDGPLAWRLRIRVLRGQILEARGDHEAAFAQYERNIDQARTRELATDAAYSLYRASALAEVTGQRLRGLGYARQALAFTLANQDSLNVPRVLMNIARRHSMNGDLDSCLAYQQRAEVWIRAYPHPVNVARMPLLQAEYYAQVGEYAVLDSLLAAAESLSDVDSAVEARAELHLELMRGWMELGRPDLFDRSLTQIADLRDGLTDTFADRHVVADLHLLTGEYMTQRGEYARAAEALDLAASALADRQDPKRAWTLARDRGRLAQARGMPAAAEAAFRECVDLGSANATPELEAAGRFLLGAALLDQDRPAEARAVLPEVGADGDGLRFTTRVSSLVLQGRAWSREGRLEPALAAFAAARAACRAWTPAELTARIELEEGRALVRAGRAADADLRFAAAAALLDGRTQGEADDEAAVFTGNLRRELVEAVMTRPGADAAASLDLARRLLPDWSGDAASAKAPPAALQVVYFLGEERSGRWLVDADGRVAWRPLPGADALRDLLAPVLADLTTPGRTPAPTPAAMLADTLLAGVADAWPAGAELKVVPDLDLFGLPWVALPLPGGGLVLDRGPLAVHDRPAVAGDEADLHRGDGAVLVIGADDPVGAGGLNALRHAEEEARHVASLFPHDEVRLHLGAEGADALRQPGTYAAIHVASHALVYAGRSDRSMIVLPGGDGAAMTGRAIRNLPMTSGLVFLSCCEAADGRDRRAGFAGLARSFLDAGARSVVAPLESVDDDAAHALAVRFYERWLAGAPVPAALRLAQMDLREDPHWEHPFYWAFYQAIVAEAFPAL